MQRSTNPRNFSPYEGPPTSTPELTGFFSVGRQGDYKDDFSELKYFKTPPNKVHFDLNRNIKNTIEKPETNVKLQSILLHFKDHRKNLIFNKDCIFLNNVPFVSSRGLLRDISALPYKNIDLRFSACLFRGILYLHHLDTPDTLVRRANVSKKEKAMTIWGHKFEKYLLSDDPNRDPDKESPADLVSSFFCVLECRIGQHHLIYRAEMDGLQIEGSSLKEGFRPEKHSREHVLQELKKLQFVELKTNRHIKKRYHNITFSKFKTLSWWLQSFFGGVDTIVCGFRNDEGIVEEIKEYKTNDLPTRFSNCWNDNICLNFCDDLLTFIKDCFACEIRDVFGEVGNVRNLPKIELVFGRLNGTHVRLAKPLPDEDISILQDWYINMFQ